MEDENDRIRRYTRNEIHVTVPDEFDEHLITQIGMGVFKNCLSLQSVTMPRYLPYLDVSVFKNCKNLMQVNLNNIL